jgi:hypothetical protein
LREVATVNVGVAGVLFAGIYIILYRNLVGTVPLAVVAVAVRDKCFPNGPTFSDELKGLGYGTIHPEANEGRVKADD